MIDFRVYSRKCDKIGEGSVWFVGADAPKAADSFKDFLGSPYFKKACVVRDGFYLIAQFDFFEALTWAEAMCACFDCDACFELGRWHDAEGSLPAKIHRRSIQSMIK